MLLSSVGLDLIKEFEGFRATTYRDSAGLLTIGYGHRLLHSDSFPEGVTKELAEHILACDVDDAEDVVNSYVGVPLTQGQFDALVDFTFNLGAQRLADSTLLKLLNGRQYDAAGTELLRWCRAGGNVMPGLQRRREAELALWRSQSPDGPAAAVIHPADEGLSSGTPEVAA